MTQKNLLILACAVSAALAVSACHRDEAGEADHAAVVVPPAPVSAPAPAASVTSPSAGVASVAPPVDSGLPFATLDRNNDGSITPDELHDNENLKLHFSEADTNGDGKLSPAEVDAYRAKEAAAKPGG